MLRPCTCVQYHLNKMYTEAINTYSLIVKNKTYSASGRLRVNVGNIYFEQKKYPMAIKMYRMALDQIGAANRDLKLKIQVRSDWPSAPAPWRRVTVSASSMCSGTLVLRSCAWGSSKMPSARLRPLWKRRRVRTYPR